MTVDQALAALASERRRFLSELDGLDDERFEKLSPHETWSAAHVCQHLVLVESGFTRGAKAAVAKGNSVRPRPVDKLRQLLITLGIADLVRIRTVERADPTRLPPVPLDRGETLDRLARTRAETVAFLEDVRGRDLSRTWLAHPFFGAYTVPDIFGWIAWHEERHRRQVSRIRRGLGLR